MEKKESQEVNSPLSPAVTMTPGVEREKEAPRKWIAAYLSGSDEDDFRKRYFKNISKKEPIQPQSVKPGSKKVASPAKLSKNESIQANSSGSDLESTLHGQIEEEDDQDGKDEIPKTLEALTVSKTEDVLRFWTKRSADDCRLWYIKTLMMKKVFSDSPSIKEQKSNLLVTQSYHF